MARAERSVPSKSRRQPTVASSLAAAEDELVTRKLRELRENGERISKQIANLHDRVLKPVR